MYNFYNNQIYLYHLSNSIKAYLLLSDNYNTLV